MVRTRLKSYLMALPFVDVSAAAGVAAPHAFAAPESTSGATAGAAGHMLQTLLALAVVLALVFLLAWLFRRLKGVSQPNTPAIEVLGHASLGPKERAVLVKVGQTRLLLGVAPGSVRTLHLLTTEQSATLPAADNAVGSVPMPRFAELLRRSLGKT